MSRDDVKRKLLILFLFLSIPILAITPKDCATLLGEISGLLNSSASGEFPVPFHKKEIQDLLKKLAPLMPVNVEQRHKMVVDTFGTSIAGQVLYTGSNENFAHYFVELLGIKGQLNQKEADGSFSLVKAIETFRKNEPPVSSEKRSPVAPTAQEQKSYQELTDLLKTPAGGEFPVPFHKKEIQDLVEKLAPLMPVSLAGRFKIVSDTFGEAVTFRIDMTGTNRNFVHALLQDLGIHGLLNKKDTGGAFSLIKGLETFRSENPLPSMEPKKTPPATKPEIEKILASPEAGKFPIFFGDPNVERLRNILAEHLPVDPETRWQWVQSVIDKRIAVNIDYEGSPNNFATNLLQQLSIHRLLNQKEKGTDYPLAKMLFP